MTSPVQREAAQWQSLKSALLRQMPDLAEDEQALLDTLEGLTNFHEQLAELIRSALWDEAAAAGMRKHMDRLADRRGHLAKRAVKKRDVVRHYMEIAGLKRINAPDMTVTRRPTPQGVMVTDADALPDEYVRVKREPDKTAIKAALKQGRDVPGATLTNAGETVSVKI